MKDNASTAATPTPSACLPVLGLLSDSHGAHERTQRAVSALVEAGATRLIHLGDLCSPAVIQSLLTASSTEENRCLPVDIVAGNCDLAHEVASWARNLEITFHDPWGMLTFGHVRIAITHGHDQQALREIAAAKPDYLLQGHTHIEEDSIWQGIRRINPGALTRAPRYTVATLDIASGILKPIDIGLR